MNETAPWFGESRIELACFEVAGQPLALEVQRVREVTRPLKLTPLPGAPALIEGLIDLRGKLIPVVDLGRALRGEPVAETPRTRIAIVEIDGLVFGLRVDAALEVIAVDVSEVGPPPPLAAQAGYEAVRAVVRRPEGVPVLVLALDHLLEKIYRSARREGGASA